MSTPSSVRWVACVGVHSLITTSQYAWLKVFEHPTQVSMTSLYCNWVGTLFIKLIEQDHRSLLRVYNDEPQFVYCCVERTNFDKGWAPTNDHFEGLCEICEGHETMFPNTTPVEADFSVIGQEKNDNRQNLTDFSLEGIIQAKNYKRLDARV